MRDAINNHPPTCEGGQVVRQPLPHEDAQFGAREQLLGSVHVFGQHEDGARQVAREHQREPEQHAHEAREDLHVGTAADPQVESVDYDVRADAFDAQPAEEGVEVGHLDEPQSTKEDLEMVVEQREPRCRHHQPTVLADAFRVHSRHAKGQQDRVREHLQHNGRQDEDRYQEH